MRRAAAGAERQEQRKEEDHHQRARREPPEDAGERGSPVRPGAQSEGSRSTQAEHMQQGPQSQEREELNETQRELREGSRCKSRGDEKRVQGPGERPPQRKRGGHVEDEARRPLHRRPRPTPRWSPALP